MMTERKGKDMMCSDDDAVVFLGISKGTLPHDLFVNQFCSTG